MRTRCPSPSVTLRTLLSERPQPALTQAVCASTATAPALPPPPQAARPEATLSPAPLSLRLLRPPLSPRRRPRRPTPPRLSALRQTRCEDCDLQPLVCGKGVPPSVGWATSDSMTLPPSHRGRDRKETRCALQKSSATFLTHFICSYTFYLFPTSDVHSPLPAYKAREMKRCDCP